MTEKTEERWTFGGRRFSYSDGKIYYVWLDEAGKELWYSKSSATVGGIYTVTITRSHSDGKDHIVLHDYKWTGDTVEEDEKTALVSKDWQAYREKDFRAREKRANATPALDRIVDDIVDLIRDWDDVTPVMGLVRSRVDKALMARERAKIKEKKS